MDPCPTCSSNTYFAGHKGLCAIVRDEDHRQDLLSRLRRTYKRLLNRDARPEATLGELRHELDTQLAGDGAGDGGVEKESFETPRKRRRITPTPEKASAMKGYMIKSMKSMLYDKKNALLTKLKDENQALIRSIVDIIPQEFDDWKQIFQETMEDHYIKCYYALDDELIKYIDKVVPMM